MAPTRRVQSERQSPSVGWFRNALPRASSSARSQVLLVVAGTAQGVDLHLHLVPGGDHHLAQHVDVGAFLDPTQRGRPAADLHHFLARDRCGRGAV